MKDQIAKNIEKGKIIPGMNTLEAAKAGGAYFFRVIADESVWGKDADPYLVIQAQAEHPDNSRIWMTFQNDTQYSGRGIQTFQVRFEKGLVVDIVNLTKETL